MSLSKTISLTVNDYDIKLSSNIKFYQNDQLKLIFEINEYGIEVSNGVKVKALMPVTPLSGTLFIETPLGVDSIESMIVENNTITFYLSSTQTQYVGVSRMQIQLSDEDGCQVTLPPFEFEIRENIHDSEVVLQQVLLSDENNNIVVDENGNAINTGTQVSAQTYSVALPAEDEAKTVTSQPTKQIKDYNLKNNVDGTEDLLIQDNGVTKRIKTSELIDTVNVDVSICYTKEEVNALLENKANIEDIPDLTGYATETFVTNKIAEASLNGGEVDLSGYATKDELNNKADISSIPNKTSQLTNDSGYITSVPSEYITETELNAKGYLTEHQDISMKADKTELHTHNNKTVLDGITSTKVTEWNNKSNFDGNYNSLTNKPNIPTVDVNKNYVDTQLATKANKSEIPSLEGYATETYVTNKIAEASLSGGEVDLSGLATKDELATKADKTAIPTKTSQLTNDSGFLTAHQNISGKADKTYVDNQLANKSNTDHIHSYNDLTDKPTIPSTNNLATKTELTNGLATKADKVHTHDQYLTEHQDLSDYALKTEIPTVPTKVSQLTNDKGYLTSVPSEYITETELTGRSYATKKELTDSLTTKSDTTHNHDTIYSKLNHTHSQYLTSVPSEYVTETELNDAISGLGSGTGNVSSDIIKSIMVVDALPEVEVEGVLYLVRGGTSTDTPTTPEEPTVTNLYPNQTKVTTSDGFTITFTGRNVTINGRNDTASIQCQTNQFDMALEANKAYYLKLTNVSGLFDDSKRVSQSDGMICMVALTVYDSSGNSKNLINWDERDARGIYEKFTFTPSSACVKGKLIIQAKKLVSFSNWTCSIVIAEEGV